MDFVHAYLDLLIGFLEHVVQRERVPRVPESEMVVETPEELGAYNNAMQYVTRVYLLYFAELFSHVINGARTVLDIGCGSGDLLITLAQANRSVHFTGTDESEIALETGRKRAEEAGVTNISFVRCDMKTLHSLPDHAFDAIISRFTLHHLKDEAELATAVSAIARVGKPQARAWIVDFQRLRSARFIRGIARRHQSKIGPLVARLYEESLHAAFDFETFRHHFSSLPFGGNIELSSLLPLYMGYYTPFYPLTEENKIFFTPIIRTFSLRERAILTFLRFLTQLRILRNRRRHHAA